jgi:dolichol-phosphate mannosyltransferase
VPITFVEREVGTSKMSRKIVTEALWKVTVWGIDRRIKILKNMIAKDKKVDQ